MSASHISWADQMQHPDSPDYAPASPGSPQYTVQSPTSDRAFDPIPVGDSPGDIPASPVYAPTGVTSGVPPPTRADVSQMNCSDYHLFKFKGDSVAVPAAYLDPQPVGEFSADSRPILLPHTSDMACAVVLIHDGQQWCVFRTNGFSAHRSRVEMPIFPSTAKSSKFIWFAQDREKTVQLFFDYICDRLRQQFNVNLIGTLDKSLLYVIELVDTETFMGAPSVEKVNKDSFGAVIRIAFNRDGDLRQLPGSFFGDIQRRGFIELYNPSDPYSVVHVHPDHTSRCFKGGESIDNGQCQAYLWEYYHLMRSRPSPQLVREQRDRYLDMYSRHPALTWIIQRVHKTECHQHFRPRWVYGKKFNQYANSFRRDNTRKPHRPRDAPHRQPRRQSRRRNNTVPPPPQLMM